MRVRAATHPQEGSHYTDALHLVCATYCNRRNPRNINDLARNRGATGVQRSRAPISTPLFHRAEEKVGELKVTGTRRAASRCYAGTQLPMESVSYLVRHLKRKAPRMGPPAARRSAGNSARVATLVAARSICSKCSAKSVPE